MTELAYSRLNLRFNPFGELDLTERQRLACVDVSGLARFLERPKTVVQFLADHGRGSKNRGEAEKLFLHQGAWQPGEYSYEFEFALFDEPISFQGRHINIDWYLRARADIPWAMDPKAVQDIILTVNPELPGENADRDAALSAGEDTGRREINLNKYLGGAIATFFLVPMFLIALVFLMFPVILMVDAWQEGNYFGLVFGGFFLAGVLSIILKLLKPYLARKKLGAVDCSLSKTVCRAGDSVDVRVFFSPPKDVDINEVSATLVLTEKAVSGSGTDRTTHSHAHRFDTKKLSGQAMLKAGSAFEKTVSLRLPDKVMHTFYTDDNSLAWAVLLKIDVPNWSDWEESQYIEVSS